MISTISALAALNQGLKYDFCNTQRKHFLTQDSVYTNWESSYLFPTLVQSLQQAGGKDGCFVGFHHAGSVASRERNCVGSI